VAEAAESHHEIQDDHVQDQAHDWMLQPAGQEHALDDHDRQSDCHDQREPAMLGRAAIPFPLDPSRVTHERALDTRAPRKCAPLFETQRGNESKKTHAGTFRGAIA
jgi:hypothetical protein